MSEPITVPSAEARPAPEERRIRLHGPEDFACMRKAGKLAAEVLDFVTPHVKPGVTTGRLDKLCHDFILDHHAIPAPLNYRGFPKSICTSVNHVVCHGIPGERVLDEGDILNIDVTVILDGWHGDTSRMYLLGERVPVKAKKLVEVTYEAMMKGIEVVKPGARLGDIGHAIQILRRGESLLGGARFLRPRHRPHLPRRALGPAFRRPRQGPGAARGHVLHHRADDQRRALGGEGLERRLDRRDQGPLAVGAVRAHRRRDGRPATRSSPSRPRAGTSRLITTTSEARLGEKPKKSGKDKPHYLGHRERLCARLLEAGPDALPDYELLEFLLFAAKPRGDTKPLAKELLKRFGGLRACWAPRAMG